MVSSWWAAARVGQRRALSLKGAQPMPLILFWWLGEDRVELPVTKHLASCIGMQKGCDKKLELQQFLKAQKIDIRCIQETHLNNTHRFSIRGYEIHRVDRADRPKGGVLTLVKTSIPSTEVQRSEKADTEYITVKLILPDRNLTICNLYSPPNKAINLQILQPNSEDWMIEVDFNSHSPSWGYPSIDAKGEEVEHWIVSNRLVLINTPTNPPTFYSRGWKTTSTPDIAIATDNNRLKRKRFKHKLKHLQKENADLLEADPGKCEELTMSVWASQRSLPEVRTEIPGFAAKGTQAPELQKALTLEMIQSHYPKSTWTHVFADGSSENAVKNGGSGAYICRPDGTTSSLSIPAGDLSSNYRAEVHALKAATELLIEEDCNQQNIVLLSDSLSALQSLTNGPTDFRTQQLHNSLRTLSDNNRVVLQWVPAHVGIAGNETADRLAKAAAKLPQPHFSTTYKEVKTVLKQKQKSAWRLRNNGFDPQKDQINTLDRRTQTAIFRLHTGHCGLRKHLKRLGLTDSAHCECGFEEPSPEHILQTCPHLETVRQQFWPEDTEVGTKLWGQAAELQRTADFLAAISLRI